MKTFLHALQFLTRIPLPQRYTYNADLAPASVAWYAPVGLLIGGMVTLLAWVLVDWLDLDPLVSGALLVAAWVTITGALHLDGLGDCADAWMGGHTPERMLEIMKDTACGIGAIVAVVLVLLVKFSAIVVLLQQGHWWLLMFPAVMSRVALVLVIRNTPYIRSSGLGSTLQNNLPNKDINLAILVCALLLFAISVQAFFLGITGCAIGWLLIHRGLIKRVRGATGDIYGALVETCEAFVLVGLTLVM